MLIAETADCAVMDARGFFPLMPAEVFDAWLAPLIATNGWPYLTGMETGELGKWPGMLLQRTPAEWARFHWDAEAVQKIDERLAEPSRNLVVQLREHVFGGLDAALNIRQSEHRFRQARQLFLELKRFPGFVTAYEDSAAKLHVVDGHHRLAALMTFEGYRGYAVPCWIARDH